MFLATLAFGGAARLATFFGLVGVTWGIDDYRTYREKALEASELERELVQTQLEALKLRLHPPFLFNALAAILPLIRTEPRAAARTVVQLGDILRLALHNDATGLVPLKTELEYIRLYLQIEQTRLSDRLEVTLRDRPRRTRGRGAQPDPAAPDRERHRQRRLPAPRKVAHRDPGQAGVRRAADRGPREPGGTDRAAVRGSARRFVRHEDEAAPRAALSRAAPHRPLRQAGEGPRDPAHDPSRHRRQAGASRAPHDSDSACSTRCVRTPPAGSGRPPSGCWPSGRWSASSAPADRYFSDPFQRQRLEFGLWEALAQSLLAAYIWAALTPAVVALAQALAPHARELDRTRLAPARGRASSSRSSTARPTS